MVQKMDFHYRDGLRSIVMKSFYIINAPRFIFPIIAILWMAQVHPANGEEKPLVGTRLNMPPRAVGLGGAMRASPTAGTSSMYFNPALMSVTPIFHLEGMYQYTGNERMNTGGGAVVDSVTSVVAAGMAFNYSAIDHDKTTHTAWDGRLSISGGIGKTLFLGATGRYLYLEQNPSAKSWGPSGPPALPASGSQQVDGLTFDAGAALRLADIVTIGVAGYNLSNTGSVFAPIELGSGVSLSLLEMLLLEADVLVDFTSHDKTGLELDVGAEIFVAKVVSIRAGYVYDIYYNMHSVAAGLGYIHPKFAVDFGFTREIRDDGRTIIALGFKLFLNNMI